MLQATIINSFQVLSIIGSLILIAAIIALTQLFILNRKEKRKKIRRNFEITIEDMIKANEANRFKKNKQDEQQDIIERCEIEKENTKTTKNENLEIARDDYWQNKYYNKRKPALTREEKIKKGKDYEYKCKRLFESKDYKVYPNGFLNGKNDDGIDLICYKEKEALIVQCKNWINPPKQDDIKIFIANADLFLKKNNHKFKNKNIRKIFITSCNKKDYGVEKFLESYNEQNEIKVEYVVFAA